MDIVESRVALLTLAKALHCHGTQSRQIITTEAATNIVAMAKEFDAFVNPKVIESKSQMNKGADDPK